jgi:hypothetical protein
MKRRICAEAQGDGVPCLSVRVACDECVRARPLRKRLRRRQNVAETPAPEAAATDSSADGPRSLRDDTR